MYALKFNQDYKSIRFASFITVTKQFPTLNATSITISAQADIKSNIYEITATKIFKI